MNSRLIPILALVVILAAAGVPCRADVAEDARKVADSNKDAVVTVTLVLETTASYEGECSKREHKMTATATVIDPSGLAVTSLAATNPSDMFHGMGGGGEDQYKSSTRVIDVEIRRSDGTETPADVVLRDRDLDLAFIRPKVAPEKPLAFVDLTKAGIPQMMDEVVLFARLGQVGSRALSGCIDRIQAVVTKPRTFYVMTNPTGIGLPTFTLDGKPVGILVMRLSQNRDDNEGSLGSMDKVLPVVLPCSTVQKAADQARVAKPLKEEEPKPTAKPAAKPAVKPGLKPSGKTGQK